MLRVYDICYRIRNTFDKTSMRKSERSMWALLFVKWKFVLEIRPPIDIIIIIIKFIIYNNNNNSIFLLIAL